MNPDQHTQRVRTLHKALGTTPPDKLAGEIGNTYVEEDERFVVSFIVGYSDDRDDVQTPRDAAYWALQLTRDEGSSGTQWYVYDRKEQTMHLLEQGDFDGEATT